MLKQSLFQFMSEQRVISRWQVLLIALAGGFAGSILTVAWMLFGFTR